jgi:WhiB family transcriptional regulator, redox-sensing transcriptional regulator
MSESPNPLFSIEIENVQPVDADNWRERAACRGVDPSVFYPTSEKEEEPARSICGACAVKAYCLDYAIANKEKDGIWGGLNEKERRRIIRARARL